MSRRTGAGPRRAPRLDPETHIAPWITRRGRFQRVDPLVERHRPSLAKMVGVAGWAALLAYSLWRATLQREVWIWP